MYVHFVILFIVMLAVHRANPNAHHVWATEILIIAVIVQFKLYITHSKLNAQVNFFIYFK